MASRIPVHSLALTCVLGVTLLAKTACANGQLQNDDSARDDSVAAIIATDPENHIAGWNLHDMRLRELARSVVVTGLTWYRRTAPRERIAWGGLAACGALGLSIFAERLIRLRARKVIPVDFASKFIDSIHDGKMDCGQALDHCERNPSPAARVALAALRRWGRPSTDLERAVALATRVESDRLRRNVSTLRRIAALAPLIGFLGTLFAANGILESATTAQLSAGELNLPSLTGSTVGLGPVFASALTPLIVGVVIAVIALVAYDGLFTRVEKLSGALDRLGAETIDAIALMSPRSVSRPIHLGTSVPTRPTDKSSGKTSVDPRRRPGT